MIDLLTLTGSFSVVWLLTWLACSLVLALLYPLLHRQLHRLDPAEASSVLLLLMAFPALLSLVSTLLLFSPGLEAGLVSEHCHENCQAHVPMVHSVELAVIGLLLMAALMLVLGAKLIFHLHVSRRLMNQLHALARPAENYCLLDDDQPLVFTLGWWRSRIFLTRGLLEHCNTTDLEVILAHENAHARRLDNIRLLLARLFLLVLPPGLAEKLYADLHVFTEAACDLVAAERTDNIDVASTLLKVQRLAPGQFTYYNSSITSAFTGAETEQRIRMLLNYRPTPALQRPLGSILCALALLAGSLLLVDPLHHSVELLLQLAGI